MENGNSFRIRHSRVFYEKENEKSFLFYFFFSSNFFCRIFLLSQAKNVAHEVQFAFSFAYAIKSNVYFNLMWATQWGKEGLGAKYGPTLGNAVAAGYAVNGSN